MKNQLEVALEACTTSEAPGPTSFDDLWQVIHTHGFTVLEKSVSQSSANDQTQTTWSTTSLRDRKLEEKKVILLTRALTHHMINKVGGHAFSSALYTSMSDTHAQWCDSQAMSLSKLLEAKHHALSDVMTNGSLAEKSSEYVRSDISAALGACSDAWRAAVRLAQLKMVICGRLLDDGFVAQHNRAAESSSEKKLPSVASILMHHWFKFVYQRVRKLLARLLAWSYELYRCGSACDPERPVRGTKQCISMVLDMGTLRYKISHPLTLVCPPSGEPVGIDSTTPLSVLKTPRGRGYLCLCATDSCIDQGACLSVFDADVYSELVGHAEKSCALLTEHWHDIHIARDDCAVKGRKSKKNLENLCAEMVHCASIHSHRFLNLPENTVKQLSVCLREHSVRNTTALIDGLEGLFVDATDSSSYLMQRGRFRPRLSKQCTSYLCYLFKWMFPSVIGQFAARLAEQVKVMGQQVVDRKFMDLNNAEEAMNRRALQKIGSGDIGANVGDTSIEHIPAKRRRLLNDDIGSLDEVSLNAVGIAKLKRKTALLSPFLVDDGNNNQGVDSMSQDQSQKASDYAMVGALLDLHSCVHEVFRLCDGLVENNSYREIMRTMNEAFQEVLSTSTENISIVSSLASYTDTILRKSVKCVDLITLLGYGESDEDKIAAVSNAFAKLEIAKDEKYRSNQKHQQLYGKVPEFLFGLRNLEKNSIWGTKSPLLEESFCKPGAREEPGSTKMEQGGGEGNIVECTAEDVIQSATRECVVKVFRLLQCVPDKDVFMFLYGQNLAKRLLGESSQSLALEQDLVSVLKEVLGVGAVQKEETMLNDIKFHRELSESFSAYYAALKRPSSLGDNVLGAVALARSVDKWFQDDVISTTVHTVAGSEEMRERGTRFKHEDQPDLKRRESEVLVKKKCATYGAFRSKILEELKKGPSALIRTSYGLSNFHLHTPWPQLRRTNGHMTPRSSPRELTYTDDSLGCADWGSEESFSKISSVSDPSESFEGPPVQPSTPPGAPFLCTPPIQSVQVRLLCQGAWPKQASLNPEIRLPPEMWAIQQIYDEWYTRTRRSHRLTWVLEQGTCVVRAIFSGARTAFMLETTTMQAILLRCFSNHPGHLSMGELMRLTGVENTAQLRELLQSLCGKGRYISMYNELKKKRTPSLQVLQMHSPVSKVNDAHNMTEESSFSVSTCAAFRRSGGSSQWKSKLPVPDIKGCRDDDAKLTGGIYTSNQKALQTVERERYYTVEATIVRCIKSRRAMRAQELEYMVQQIPNSFFAPSKEFIRRCINKLEQRDYLQRDETDAELLVYVP